MSLSSDLISQFVKATNDTDKKSTETTLYGTVKNDSGEIYVQLDGASDGCLTPVSSTTTAKDGDRVTVMIKDHTAIITGNITDPSASSEKVEVVDKSITELGTVRAHKISANDFSAINATIDNLLAKVGRFDQMEAVYAEIETLKTKFIEGKQLTVEEANILTAEIDNLKASFGKFTDIDTTELDAMRATIDELTAYTAQFTFVETFSIEAFKANLELLTTKKLSAIDADIKYANIDFANINEAAVKKIFSDSGIIKDLIVSEGKITGELVGVTIKGKLIEAGTLKADRLVVLGSDGKYYKLNTDFAAMPGVEPVEADAIHGSVLIEKSIVAEKIAVDDLVAFGATIAGFILGPSINDDGTEGPDAIYSKAKTNVHNGTRGFYLDSSGHMNVGDSISYVKFYFDETARREKLEISADSINFKTSNLKVGARNLIRNSDDLIFSSHNFVGSILDEILEGQAEIISAQDEISGETTVVTAGSETFDDFETALDSYISEQEEILAKQNELIGGDAV